MVFLQFLYDLSDREVEEQINLHLACKWFAGLQPEETPPDHSTLCRFRSRLGPEKFQAIFNEIIQRARHAGLIHDRLRIIDATHLQAKVELFRLPARAPDTPAAEAPGSPDPDARFGRKSKTKSCYGYKEHMGIDADSELITAVAVTPGNVADSQVFSPLIDPQAREVTADKGYDTDANHQRLKHNGQGSSIIVKKNRTNTEILGPANSDSQRERPNIYASQAHRTQVRRTKEIPWSTSSPLLGPGQGYHASVADLYRGQLQEDSQTIERRTVPRKRQTMSGGRLRR